MQAVLARGWVVTAGPFRPATGPYTTSAVLAELARLWDLAQHHRAESGALTQARLARVSGVSISRLSG
jgi:hypothetical protein